MRPGAHPGSGWERRPPHQREPCGSEPCCPRGERPARTTSSPSPWGEAAGCGAPGRAFRGGSSSSSSATWGARPCAGPSWRRRTPLPLLTPESHGAGVCSAVLGSLAPGWTERPAPPPPNTHPCTHALPWGPGSSDGASRGLPHAHSCGHAVARSPSRISLWRAKVSVRPISPP